MVSSSKILTVSYGTFSCTAEGFDDPLAVIKDATQFYRTVVKEEPWFGAEPQQLDPEMVNDMMRSSLATQDSAGQLTLSNAAPAASAGAMTAALAAGPARTTDLPDDSVLEQAAREAEAEAEAHEEALVEEAAIVETAVEADPTDAEDVQEIDLSGVLAEAAPTEEADAALDEMLAPEPEAQPAPEPVDNSVAARLERIRNVVAENEGEAEAEIELAEEEPAEDEVETDNVFTDTIAGIMQNDLDDEITVIDDADENGDDISSALQELEDRAAEASDAKVEEIDEWQGFTNADWETVSAAEPQIEDLENADDDDLEEALADALDLDDDITSPEPEVAPARAPLRKPTRARVVKVKRAVFEKAVDDGTLEEVDEEPEAPTSELSRQDEAELARELEAVKAELASDFDLDDDDEDDGWDMPDPEPLRLDNPITAPEPVAEPDELDDPSLDALQSVRKTVKMANPGRAMLTEGDVQDDDASRLMHQTEEEMEEPEGNRRRSAIAHLRAAVAATRADRLLGGKSAQEEEADLYREDLANVVRPRRPQSGESRTERPAAAPAPQSAAPLTLVAEQRVVEPTGNVTPVRPRRVARIVETPAMDDDQSLESDFVTYAEQVGASDLPQLLEAAAAYMSYVKGIDQFSRPQLMSTLRSAETEESSREDRLRSFGELLREGKIEKTSGGRFTASDSINFKPGRMAG